MKKMIGISTLVLIIIIVISLLFAVRSSDEFYTDTVIDSVGVAITEDYYQYGWWQDYTIYAKYTFENPEYENNEYLKQMSEEDIEKFKYYLTCYGEWLDVIDDDLKDRELIRNYDFDKSIISTNDYCYINDYTLTDPEFEMKPDSYNLYFYDYETKVLYYFHTNI